MYFQPKNRQRDNITNGTIEIKGDYTQYTDYSQYSPDVTLKFTGEEQTITNKYNNYDIIFPNLVIGNNSSVTLKAGVKLSGTLDDNSQDVSSEKYVYVDDINQIISKSTRCNIYVNKASVLSDNYNVMGNLRIYKGIDLNGYRLDANDMFCSEGNLYINGGYLNVANKFQCTYLSNIIMNNPMDYICIGGAAIFENNNPIVLEDGTIELDGDITISKGIVTGTANSKTLFNSKVINNRPYIQKITMNESSKFNILTITKPVEAGYVINRPIEDICNELICDYKDVTSPDKVTNLVCESKTASTITLSWDKANDDIGTTMYDVYRDGVKVNSVNTEKYVDKGLKVDAEYTYYVVAKDGSLNSSEESDECVASTDKDTEAPTVPVKLSIYNRTGSSIGITWNKSTDNSKVAGYKVYRNGEYIGKALSNKYSDGGLENNANYTYTVVAYDESGNESIESIELETVTKVAEIYKVTPEDKSDIGGDTINLKAEIKNAGSTAGYTVNIAYSQNGEYVTIGEALVGKGTGEGANISYDVDWDISKITGSVNVRFTVTDVDGNTYTMDNDYYLATEAPKHITGFKASTNAGVIKLVWDKAVNVNTQKYIIYKKTGTGEYEEYKTIDAVAVTYFNDIDIVEGETYSYGIKAVDKWNQSSKIEYTDEIVADGDDQCPKVKSILPKDETIGGIVDLEITASDNKAVDKVRAYYRTNNEEWTLIDEVDYKEKTIITWDSTGLNGDYEIKVEAIDTIGNVNEDEFVQEYVLDNTGIDDIPNLRATGYDTSIILEWDEITDQDYDHIDIEQKGSNGEYEVIGTSTTVLGYQVDDLLPDTEYTYRIVAYDLIGNKGAYSKEITCATISDTTAPYIVNVSPQGGSYNEELPIDVTVSDNSNLASIVVEYSLDNETWNTICDEEATGLSYRMNTSLALTDIPEGAIYLRAYGRDTSGNVGNVDGYTLEYTVDRTAPEKIHNITANSNSGYVELKWNGAVDQDVHHYEVYRSEAEIERYTLIEDDSYYVNYIDRDISYNKTYKYKVCAVDHAGNHGEFSEVVMGQKYDDTIAPTVHNVIPEEASYIRDKQTIETMVSDNDTVDYVEFKYKSVDGDIWNAIEEVKYGKANGIVKCSFDTTSLDDGDYIVSIVAVDICGNTSRTLETEYIVDNTSPNMVVLTATPKNWKNSITWTNDNLDIDRVELLRKTPMDKEYQVIYEGADTGLYLDKDVNPMYEYSYKISVYDKAGNVTTSNTRYAKPLKVDDERPVAYITSNSVTVEGYEMVLDGIFSTDNDKISSYAWDFGDGSTGTGAKALHIYKKAGTYTAKLIVKDKAGNSNTTKATVKVLKKDTVGKVHVHITDGLGKRINNAWVYVNTGDSNNMFYTDELGVATIILEPGEYDIAMFKEGYVAKESKVTIHLFDDKDVNLTMEKGKTVKGDLNVRQLTFDEIEAAGIDIKDPSNNHVVKVDIKLKFGPSQFILPYNVPVVFNSGFTAIMRTTDVSNTPSGGGGGQPPSWSGVGSSGGTEEKKEHSCIEIIEISQSISWLKDMYEAKLDVYNMSDSPNIILADNKANIKLPSGVSLANTATPQTATIEMGDIRGGGSDSALWYLRGDERGDYKVSVEHSGTLMPFDVPINNSFESTSFKVTGGEGLVLHILAEDIAAPGEYYYVYFNLINEGTKEFYNVKTTFGTAPSSSNRYIRVTSEDNKAMPIMSEGDMLSIPCLQVGEGISGVCKFNLKGTGMEATSTSVPIWRLCEYTAESISAENLGVSVVVSPIPTHVNLMKYAYDHVKMPEVEEADPVNVVTGGYTDSITPISMQGGSAISAMLYYSSLGTDELGEFGYGWTHNYEKRIVDMNDGTIRLYNSPSTYSTYEATDYSVDPWYIDEDGYQVLDSSLLPVKQSYKCLNKKNDGDKLDRDESGKYTLVDENGNKEYYDEEGNLTKLESASGKSVSVVRTTTDVTITDNVSGKYMVYKLNENGLVDSITDSASRTVHFYYNENNQLVTYENAIGERIYYTYDNSNRILTVTDNSGNTYVTNTYDESGRVTCQLDGLGASTKFSYSVDEDTGITTTTTTTRSGGVKTTVADAAYNVISETNELGYKGISKYDLDGNLIYKKDANGNATTYEYDENNNMTKMVDAYGNVTTMTYNEDNNLVSSNNTNGEYVHMTYYDNNLVKSVTDQNGNTKTYTYDSVGQLIEEKDSKGSISYTYSNGEVVATKDKLGHVTHITYTATGKIKATTTPEGATTSFTYDNLDRMLTETNPLGGVTSYTYATCGQVATKTNPLGGVTSFTYNNNYQLEKAVTPDGATTIYSYTPEGLVSSITDSQGNSNKKYYDIGGNLITEVDNLGNETKYTYDKMSNLVSETAPNGAKTSYSYYPNGNVATMKDALGEDTIYTYEVNWRVSNVYSTTGDSISYIYDGRGNVRESADGLGNVTKYTYDTMGNVTSITDPNGAKTSYTYDAVGNKIQVKDALGNKTTYEYDKDNKPIKVTKADGTYVSCEYDAAGNVVKTIDEEGNPAYVEYDVGGNETKLIDAYGKTIESYSYNGNGSMINKVNGLGEETSYTYNTEGFLTQVTNPDGTISNSSYDILGRITTAKDELGHETAVTYDSVGNTTIVTNANGATTNYEYDIAGRVTKVINPLGYEESYTYNSEQLLEKYKNANNDTVKYTYDTIGRITSVKDDVGKITYTYDNNGKIITVSEHGDTIKRTYDKLNRITSVTDYKGDTVSYSYDEVGNLISLTYPGGEIVRYSYYKNGLLKTVKDWDNRVTNYSYDKNGRLTKTIKADGSIETKKYDVLGRVIEQTDITDKGEVIERLEYSYDKVGNIVSKTVDSEGTDGLVSAKMTYDDANRLVTYNGEEVKYDKVGNMIYGPVDDKMTTLKYDSRNRLVEAGGTTYTYDACNNRIASTTDKVETTYVVDTNNRLSQVLIATEDKGATTKYVYGNNLLIGKEITGSKSDYKSQSNGYHVYHFDNIGSTTAITSEAGVIEVSYSYGPYGELLTYSEGEDFLYNGAYGVATDDNGLYYMRARYYNPSIKRFINQDVVTGDISNSASLNRYAYCEGNPINQSDPFGLSPTSEDGSGGGDSSKYATLHTVLSIVGLIPGLGDVCDVVNAIAYFSEGDMLNCVLSLVSALPGVGGVVAGIGSKLNKIGKLCKVAKACDVVGTTLKVAGKTVTAGSCFYESGKCAVDAYFAYEANGNKLDGEVLKKAGGSIIYGVLGKWSLNSAIGDTLDLKRAITTPAGCFVAGTKVATLDGYKNIEDIKTGDYVYSENPETGEKGYKKVLTTYEREKDIKVTLRVTDEEGNEDTIETTIEHPFWVEELGGYVKAKDLHTGDHFRLLDGRIALLEDVKIENTDIFTVYNLEVEDWHTYYVGEMSILVHNMCASDAAAKKPKESVSSSGKKNGIEGGKTTGTYGELVSSGQKDAHHIIQDAAMRDIPGYNRFDAPAVQLDGPSNVVGTEHYYATVSQRRKGGGTYGAERGTAYISLRKAGLSIDDAKAIVRGADNYFMGKLGLTLDSPTRIPGNRRK